MLFHLRIQLTGITEPPVWRELIVPASFSFHKLHNIIQAAFGWEDAHLYLFSPEGFASSPQIKIPDEMDEEGDSLVLDASKTKLKDIFPASKRYVYIYDFGDSWEHEIMLLRMIDETKKHGMLTAGKGACPPEDCGGHWGYADLKQKLKDPSDPEHEQLREWLGLEEDDEWDAAAFELREAQERVADAR